MDWAQFKQTLCDDLRPNALDAMNPYVPINAVMPMVEYQDAENTRLKEQLARTERERDQAIEVTRLEECDKTDFPELHEHLWHLAELRNDLRAMRGE